MIRVLPDAEAVAVAAAEELVARASGAVRETGRFTLALAGGRTPRRLYELLATAYRPDIPWSATHVFWGDERCVPPDDPASNYGLARRTLLDRVPVPPEAVHRVRGELPPVEAAADYHRRLADFFGAGALDVVILGVGPDGHTASLFPGQVEPDDPRWARAVRAPEGVEPRDRVTLTLRALNAAGGAIVLATGPEKRAVVASARAAEGAGETGAGALPATRVRPATGALWLVDRGAAG